MDEDDLRRVLLARACEESDPEGLVLPDSSRDRASREAKGLDASTSDPDSAGVWLAARAERLLESLSREHPALCSVARWAGTIIPLWAVLLGGIGLGLGLDVLGRERRINLLAFPLMGLLAWNLGVYAFGLTRGLLGAGRSLETFVERAIRVRTWLAKRGRAASHARGFVARALGRFGQLWLEAAGALEAARWRARLHAGAAGLVAGVVGGMYVAGLAFDYQAGWESTFLDRAQTQRVLNVVLGPASKLLRVPVPELPEESISSPATDRLDPARTDAAPWIHLWATTALLVVGLPRLALAGWEGLRARRLGARLAPDLEAPYFVRLLAFGRGEDRRVRVIPYSTELSPRAAATLRVLLHELFGNRSHVTFEPSARYGDEPPSASSGSTVVVFNLAQSPEQEVHGAFLEVCMRGLEPEGASLLVVLDEERYRDVVDAERLNERQRAWQRVLREVGLTSIRLEPTRDGEPELLSEARDALWPARAGTPA